jgi:hypothetical protein
MTLESIAYDIALQQTFENCQCYPCYDDSAFKQICSAIIANRIANYTSNCVSKNYITLTILDYKLHPCIIEAIETLEYFNYEKGNYELAIIIKLQPI